MAAEPRVRVEEVAFPPVHPHRLADRGLDHPRVDASDTGDVYALRIGGWAIGDGQPVRGFELVHRGLVLETVPAMPGDDEFAGRLEFAISSLDLPYTFELLLRAVLEDGTRARVATLSGSRAALCAAAGPGPSPVLVTTIGRSGSTAVTNLLCHHPDFAGYRTWDRETRVVSYWTEVLRTLARPASYERQLHRPVDTGAANSWVGAPPLNLELPPDEPALPGLGRTGVEAVAAFCRSQIGLIGSTLAGLAGKPGARYFVEKAQPRWDRSVAEVSEELDPRAREIVLVRDLRDVACSMVAYTGKTGVRGFGPHDSASVEDTIRWLSGTNAANLAGYVEHRGAHAHLLRYEDVIMRPETALTEALEYIGADARPQTVALMLERLAAESERRDVHATTDSVQSSLGRWRRELDAEQQALAEHHLRPQLDALGYE